VYRSKELPLASDSYSTQFETQAESRPVNFTKLIDIVKDTVTHKETIDLPSEAEHVLDAWCEPESLIWSRDGGYLTAEVKINACIITKNHAGEVDIIERPLQTKQRFNIPDTDGELDFDPVCSVVGSVFALNGTGGVDIRCEVHITGPVTATKRENCLIDLSVDEETPKLREHGKMYICYADKGESIWNIAKHYNTSAEQIWEENGLETDILPQKAMLLIPIV
jgi:hypothetical protein